MNSLIRKIERIIKDRLGEETNFFTVILKEDGEITHFGFGCEKCMSEILKDISEKLSKYPHFDEVEEFIKKIEEN